MLIIILTMPINVDQNKDSEKNSRHLFFPVIGDVRSIKTIIKLIIILFSSLLAGCASPTLLKIDDLMNCLGVSNKIEPVTYCISEIGSYKYETTIEGDQLAIDTIRNLCRKEPYSSCSDNYLAESLPVTTGELTTSNEQGEIINTVEYDSIAEPARVFSSNIGYPLGGASVRLFIFYTKQDGRVLGWVNHGAARNLIDFDSHKQIRNSND